MSGRKIAGTIYVGTTSWSRDSAAWASAWKESLGGAKEESFSTLVLFLGLVG